MGAALAGRGGARRSSYRTATQRACAPWYMSLMARPGVYRLAAFAAVPRFALAALALSACGGEELRPLGGTPPLPPESCAPLDLAHPGAFSPCSLGSGSFGRWVLDDAGLPAYDYWLDEPSDDRALFFNTEGLARRDHWHAFGNHRLNALAFNDGHIELVSQDEGPSYLNKRDDARGAWSGGYSYLDDGEETWTSAYDMRPPGAPARRTFGLGYAESVLEHRGLRLTRRSFAPASPAEGGDAPAAVTEVVLENLSGEPRSLAHYEAWDVARRPVEIDWIVSGSALTSRPENARTARDGRNALFEERAEYEPALRLLGVRRRLAAGVVAPLPMEPSPVEYRPGDPFLASLVGDPVDAWASDDAFLGQGGPRAPSAVVTRTPGLAPLGQALAAGPLDAWQSALGQPHALVMKHRVELAPWGQARLRFAVGFAPMGEAWTVPASWREPERDLGAETLAWLGERSFTFATEREPFLRRELAWHAAQLEQSVGRRSYWGRRVVPQGSAYRYLHGADGAARDLSLFALPLVYVEPELAKDELAMNMLVTHADGRISYAFQGHGMLDDALGLHARPSDLDLFLLLALGEYLGATGDLAFLDEPMPYWPLGAVPGATVWDHLRGAVRHLFDAVGTGAHGLVRVGTGDWSDGILQHAPDRELAIAAGESVPNTQMAVAVLPRVADLVAERDPPLASEIRAHVADLRAALDATWTGSFFGRAYFGDGVFYGADAIDLEAQVWALIGDTFPAAGSPADRQTLLDAIASQLDDPSPAGAMLSAGGEVWPAISGLLTWGYARSDPERAFAHLARNTLAGHALAYPDVWYGIWSGPDGLRGPSPDRPGESWYSPVTPMTDFPVMNANQHAMPLLAALRVAGVEATATGLRLEPRVPDGHFALRTRLVDLSQDGPHLEGTYRPLGPGPRSVHLVAPGGATILSATANGAPVPVAPDARELWLEAPGGAPLSFSLETTFGG